MKPKKLTLEGFQGIRSGRSKNAITIDLESLIPKVAVLVAITGPNGSGKTTIMDNLHPFRMMPSHSSTLSVGGFSYWDNIFGTTAKKELEWDHEGVSYRSTLTFKSTGKTQKADAYLFSLDHATGSWKPVSLPDGTLSDGKSATYDQCIEAILGTPESFFTSHFAAQGRRPLSSYAASEIKALLASILDLGNLREKAAKANMVGRMLKLELDQLQDVLAQARGATAGIEQINLEIAGFDQALAGRAEVELAEQAKIDDARRALALLEAKRDTLAKDEEQRTYLTQQITAAQTELEQARQRAEGQHRKDMQAIILNRTRATEELAREKAKQSGVAAEIARLQMIIGRQAEIQAACAAIPALREGIETFDQDIEANQAKIDAVIPVREQLSRDQAAAAGITTAGKSKVEFITSLKQTAELINRVPCHGMDIQLTCPLLKNANEAQAKISPEEVKSQEMRRQYSEVKARIDANIKLVEACAGIEVATKALVANRRAAAVKLDQANQLAAMAPLLAEAQRRTPELEQSVQAFKQLQDAYDQTMREQKTAEDELEGSRKAYIEGVEEAAKRKIAELQQRLEKLAAPVTESELANARSNVQAAMDGLNKARVTTQSYRDQRNDLSAKLAGLNAVKASTQETTTKAGKLADEIAKWRLIEHGCGNNGLIALSIDDAGPEITSYCNELLRECYGPRFSIRLDTQAETKAGHMKETFDVRVYDGQDGEEKSLTNMSPGERVWINECLARSIALYGADSSGKNYQTLFTDETDGPLDTDRKRRFIDMKRAVLKQGGYEREYFISHTPELWEMADCQLDVSTL